MDKRADEISARLNVPVFIVDPDSGDVLTEVEPEPEAEPDVRPAFLRPGKPEKPVNGTCMSKAQALAEARQAYGAEASPESDFTVKKTARGLWYWGPYEAPHPIDAAFKAKPKKGEKRAAKAEKSVARKAEKVERAANGAEGPSGMAGQAFALACRPQGATPAELNALTKWKGMPWKWSFRNPKGTGWCDKYGFTLEVVKVDGAATYKVTKKA